MNGGSRRNVAKVNVAIIGEMRVEGHANESRSHLLSTATVTKGSRRSAPPLTTRSVPVCSHRNTRPSGATAIAVAPVIPAATRTLEKPGGSAIGPMMPLPGVPCPADRRLSRKAITSVKSRGVRPAANPSGISDVLPWPLHNVQLTDDMPATVGVDERQFIGRLLLDDS